MKQPGGQVPNTYLFQKILLRSTSENPSFKNHTELPFILALYQTSVTLNPTSGTLMKKLASLVLACSAITLALPASAQFAKPEDAIKYRQSAFFIMAQNFGRVAAMAQGKVPFDAKLAADSAANAEFMAKLPWGAFGEGTDKGGIPTRAKAEIWSDKAKFNEYADKMQAEMTKFNAAAKTGSLDNIKAAMGAVGGSCKACHDAFQAKL
jgi:cytochrome c556